MSDDTDMWYVTYPMDGDVKILDMFKYQPSVPNSTRRRLVCNALGLDEKLCGSYKKAHFEKNRKYV